jgi:nucleobase:cation symporter-1, NCS1 family
MTPAGLTSLWVAVTLGAPVIVVGFRLMAGTSQGGLGLSVTQLLLAVPLGVVAAVGVLWVTARPGSAYGEGLGVLLRPSFGVVGAWLYLLVHLSLLIVISAFGLRIFGAMLAEAIRDLGYVVPVSVGIGIAAAAAVIMGIAGALQWWVRRIAFWGGLAAAMWIAWRLASGLDFQAASTQSRSPMFWLGVDMIIGLAVLFFPLVVDTTRSLQDERTAPASVGAGFGVSALIVLMVGGLAAMVGPGTLDPSTIMTSLGSPSGGIAATLALLAWLVFAQLDQAAVFLVSPTRALGSLGIEAPVWVAALVGPVLATGVAVLSTSVGLFDFLRFLISLLTPILGIFLSDYYVVRGGAYLSRDLYRRKGAYRGVNLAAVLALIAGFAVYQWISPVGPVEWVTLIEDGLPWAPLSAYGVPAVIVSLAVSVLAYSAAGRFLVREESYVSHVRPF